MPRYILLENQTVVATRVGHAIADGEIQNDVGELGQILQGDGTFTTPPVQPAVSKSTLEEEVKQLKHDNLMILEVISSTFKEVLNIKAQLGGTP